MSKKHYSGPSKKTFEGQKRPAMRSAKVAEFGAGFGGAVGNSSARLGFSGSSGDVANSSACSLNLGASGDAGAVGNSSAYSLNLGSSGELGNHGANSSGRPQNLQSSGGVTTTHQPPSKLVSATLSRGDFAGCKEKSRVDRTCEFIERDFSAAPAKASARASGNGERIAALIDKFDLTAHVAALYELFARPKPLALGGDVNVHLERIEQLCAADVRLAPAVPELGAAVLHLKKLGTLHLGECAQFFKINEFINYLKSLALGGSMGAYLAKITAPDEVNRWQKYFKNGEFAEELDERFAALDASARECAAEQRAALAAAIRSAEGYLIDTNVHFFAGCECLLARAGYAKVCAANVCGRSQNGGFYIQPAGAARAAERLGKIASAREEIYAEYAGKISADLAKVTPFLGFINREFDLLDAYCARANFAVMNDLEFFAPAAGGEILLKDFIHPALSEPKPVSAELSRDVLIITGVNAGGKSMLLKSICAASFMSKYLLPFRAHKSSRIAVFKDYFAIVADPQNSANNISTFAGRMRSFSEVFGHKNFLLAVDEIELGTDFEEAAVLFYELISELKTHGKIIITTHHKRLAMLLASKPFVQLLAALYDEATERPKYEFLEGIIGKSYAFETAARYGIPAGLIARANEHFSEQEKSLNEMMNKNLELDAKLKMQLAAVEKKEAEITERLGKIKAEQHEQKEALKARKIQLEREYLAAIDAAKKTLDFKELRDKQRQINAAHDAFARAQAAPSGAQKELKIFKVGDVIRYEKTKAKITAIAKNAVTIDANGIKMRVSREAIERCNDGVFERPSAPKVHISAKLPKGGASVKLDLHGLRAEEAIERCEKFISDALLAGFSEVLIYHGIGTGALAAVVKQFLTNHPKVAEFSDAPPNQGGFGAKIVKF